MAPQKPQNPEIAEYFIRWAPDGYKWSYGAPTNGFING